MTVENHNDNGNKKHKTNVYILRDMKIKKLNCYLLAKDIKCKHLIKGRFVSGQRSVL